MFSSFFMFYIYYRTFGNQIIFVKKYINEAIEFIKKNQGTMFNPEVVEAFGF